MLLKTDNNNKFGLLDVLIHLDTRFAIYRLPFSEEPIFVMQNSTLANKYYNIQDLGNEKGFIIAPFCPNETKPIISISPDTTMTSEADIFSFLEKYIREIPRTQERQQKRNTDRAETGMEVYSIMFDSFISGLAENNLSKLVLSRTLTHNRIPNFSAGNSFKLALDKFTNSFVYLCHTPETGTWLGSSPEMLLSGQGSDWHTVALAGTKHISEANSWDNKNKVEQEIVVNFVEEQLAKASVTNIVKTNPEIIEAGNVAHLKSDFSFNIQDKEQIGDLLQLLHPTPAVCGYPKDAAYDFIVNTELHDRRYYSGFVGYLDCDNVTDLYVNLRCMEIRDKDLLLYAGGGILPSSEKESEWKETENKLQTMLSVIQEK